MLPAVGGEVLEGKQRRNPPTIIKPPSTLFRTHIFLRRGVRTRHRTHVLDLEKSVLVIKQALGHPNLHHIYVSRVEL